MTYRALGDPNKTVITKNVEFGKWWVEIITKPTSAGGTHSTWRIISANNEVVCYGLGYDTPEAALRTVSGVFGPGVEVRFYQMGET